MHNNANIHLITIGIAGIFSCMNESLASSVYKRSDTISPVYDSVPKTPATVFNDANILVPGESMTRKTSDNLFVKAVVSKQHSYIGEPIFLTYILYSRMQANTSINTEPVLHGFSKVELTLPNGLSKSKTEINGKEYELIVLKKLKLVPIMEGKLQIDPILLKHHIRYVKNIQPTESNQLSDLLGNLLQQENAESIIHDGIISSKPISIEVKSLPDKDQFTEFNNAIGQFTLKATVNSSGITNQLMKLRLEISGNGDLSFVEPPSIQWPKDLVLQEVEEAAFHNTVTDDFRTSKVFIYHFIAVNQGKMVVPPVLFNYFDPTTHAYKSTKSNPLNILVSKGTGTDSATSDKDIKKSITVGDKLTREKPMAISFTNKNWWIATGVGLLFGLTLIFLKMLTLKKKKIITVQTEPSPNKVLEQYLETADHKGFYLQLNRFLWTRITNTLNLSPSESTKQNIDEQLQLRNWTMQDRCILRQLLCECDWNLYAPIDENEMDLQPILREAKEILDKLS